MPKIFNTFSEQETASLGAKLARLSCKGDVFALYGTLGMGKSVFARGFVQELTSAEEVPSPTFTLVQSYDGKDFTINHFDLYRLKDPDEVFELDFEDALYQGVSLIEWPEKAGNWLPKDIFKVEILPEDNGRKIIISAISSDKQNRLEQLK